MDADRNELLASMLEAVSASTVGEQLLERVLAEVVASGPWTHGVFWVTDRIRGATMRAAAVVAPREGEPCDGSSFATVVRRRPLEPGVGFVGRAHRAGVVTTAERPGDDERFADGPCRAVAALAHPVTLVEQVIAVMELLTVVPAEEADATAPLTAAVAEWSEGPLVNVAPALGHLFERYRNQVQAEEAEGRLAAVLDAGDFGVATFDRRIQRVQWSARMAAHHGMEATDGVGSAAQLLANVHPDDVAAIEEALATAAAELAQEPVNLTYRVCSDDGTERWVATRLTVPTMASGQVVTALVSSDVTERRALEREHRRRRDAVAGLGWVTQAILGGRDLDESADALVRAATSVLGASFGVVVYRRPVDTGERVDWTHTADGDTGPAPSDIRVLDEIGSEPVRLDLAASSIRDALASWDLPVDLDAMASVLVAPVRGATQDLLGTMVFLHPERRYFTDDDLGLVTSIARSAGTAIDNEKRHEEQRLAATAFQRALLPRTDTTVAGAEVCVRYHPGRNGLEVGGDWFDVIRLDDNRVGLAVGDVCGHGVSAAAAMGQFRFSFRAMVQTSTPERAFGMLNEMALHQLSTTLTLVYVEVDVRTGEMAVWSAGHLPPVSAAPDAAPGAGPVFLGADADRAPMLGFIEDIQVRGTVGHLAPGHTLLLYTDGLIERRDESIEVGLARLAGAFAGRSPGIEELCDELYDLLATVGPTADDTALLAFRRR